MFGWVASYSVREPTRKKNKKNKRRANKKVAKRKDRKVLKIDFIVLQICFLFT